MSRWNRKNRGHGLRRRAQPFGRRAVGPAACLLLAACLGIMVGCSRPNPDPPTAGTTRPPASAHQHLPPHGGTVVVLGAEAFHLELVADAPAGRLTAYVLDSEMENFVRVSTPSFKMHWQADGTGSTIIFRATPNRATGETIGDTSQFEADADWLRTRPAFEGEIEALEIRGTRFTGVRFRFPQGNDKD